MKKTFLSAIALITLGSAASASTYVLDFDAEPTNAAEVASLDSGALQNITNPRTFLDGGVQWSVQTGGGDGAALFDTTCSYGFGTNGCAGDPDLFVSNQANADNVSGNVLIQQESNNPGSPDDDARTNSIVLTLLSDITLEWTGASAVDDGFYRFLFGGSELGTIDIASDNQTGSVVFGTTALLQQNDSITVLFERSATNSRGASGAVDNFTFNVPAVPIPASLPLLMGGFGLMAFMRRRRKA